MEVILCGIERQSYMCELSLIQRLRNKGHNHRALTKQVKREVRALCLVTRKVVGCLNLFQLLSILATWRSLSLTEQPADKQTLQVSGTLALAVEQTNQRLTVTHGRSLQTEPDSRSGQEQHI